MIKITCTEEMKNTLIHEGFNFNLISPSVCQKVMGVSGKECSDLDCKKCKAQNIEWEIVEDEKKEEKKEDSPKFTIREIAKMLRDCNETPCSKCPLDALGDCSERAGKMILDQLESSEDVPPITWDEIQGMMGQEIYARNPANEIEKVIPIRAIENNGVKYVKLYWIDENIISEFHFTSPVGILSNNMRLYRTNPDEH